MWCNVMTNHKSHPGTIPGTWFLILGQCDAEAWRSVQDYDIRERNVEW